TASSGDGRDAAWPVGRRRRNPGQLPANGGRYGYWSYPPSGAHRWGGTAGVSVGARLRRAGVGSVGIIEPSERHYYQPLWTLVGGGRAPVKESVRAQASVMPQGAAWIKDRAEE